MSRKKRILLIGGALVVAGLLFTALILPIIVRSQLEQQVGKATGRACSVRSVSINPLNWSVAVKGVRLAERDARATFVSFSSLGFRISPTSIYRMAPVVNDLKVHAPYVHLVRTAPNSYNFTDIIERQPKKEGSSPQRFSLNNIVLDSGSVDFEDLALAKPTRHSVRDLALQLPFISNISYFADSYVDPKVSAVVNGAPFNFNGKVKPFDKGKEATVKLDLKKMDIPYYAAYIPATLPVEIRGGILSTDLEISHRLVEGGKPDLDIRGKADLQGLNLTEKSGRPLLGVKGIQLEIAKAELLKKEFDITSLEIDSPEFTASRDAGGGWNFQNLGKKTAGDVAKEQEKPAKGETKPRVLLRSLAVSSGTVNFSDAVPRGGYSTAFQEVELEVENLATYGSTPASYSLSFATRRGEQGEAEGDLLLEPLAVNSRVSFTGLVLEAAYPYLAGMITAPVKGRADFSSGLAFSGDKGLTLDQARLGLKGVRVPFGPTDFLQLTSVIAEGGSLRLKDRTAAVSRITIAGGSAELSRDETGRMSTDLLKQPAVSSLRQSGEGTPIRWKLGRLAISGFDAAFTDKTREESPRFALGKIKADASSMVGPVFGEFPFAFAAVYGGQGELSAKGRFLPAPLKLKADLVVKRLPLLDFEPYLPEGINVLLLDGKLDSRLSVDIARKGDVLAGTFRGDGGIRDFHVLDEEEEEDLLKWESLQLNGISGTLSPFSLSLNGVSLNNYYARVIINKGGRINLQELYTPPAGKTGEAPPAAPVAAAAQSPQGSLPAKPAQAVRIDSITLQDGRLNFTDHHLNRDFSTTMLNLGGRVTGLSSDAATLADIDLRGNLENHSPLKVTGKINPLRGDLFLDMTINFSEIELSPMSPYSGTYLGYAIDKGKLSLALKYKVDQKKLSAENKVFLDQFTFGEKIESPKATSLPVRLAVALLKDRKGEIHLDLPLSGRTDDPKFSIWGVIGQILKNLLVKAATSPLSLLQSAFGGGEDFSSIAFAPGSSHLDSAEEAKLGGLARALTERPGIKLEIAGFADRERDPEGYRNELLLKKMKSEKFLAVVKEKRESTGLSADSMEIPQTEQSRWLKAVYEKEKFPRPRTIIGTLKSLPDSEMRKLILANTVVGDQQLRQLARDRAVAVTTFLVREGKLPQERLFEKSGDTFAPPAKEGVPGSRVEFGVVD